jgi:hypothetical protein
MWTSGTVVVSIHAEEPWIHLDGVERPVTMHMQVRNNMYCSELSKLDIFPNLQKGAICDTLEQLDLAWTDDSCGLHGFVAGNSWNYKCRGCTFNLGAFMQDVKASVEEAAEGLQLDDYSCQE